MVVVSFQSFFNWNCCSSQSAPVAGLNNMTPFLCLEHLLSVQGFISAFVFLATCTLKRKHFENLHDPTSFVYRTGVEQYPPKSCWASCGPWDRIPQKTSCWPSSWRSVRTYGVLVYTLPSRVHFVEPELMKFNNPCIDNVSRF